MPEPRVYEATTDPGVLHRIRRAELVLFWRSWVGAALRFGSMLAIVNGLSCLVASQCVGPGAPLRALVAAGLGFVFGCIWVALGVLRRLNKKSPSETWACEMNDETWSFRKKNGAARIIPWKLMKLRFEHPDGWLVAFGAESVWVLREPLRKAELEHEFRKRAAFTQR